MAAYEVLLLNTAIPQIQAAQSGDTYVVPRDIAINATAIISANSATDALRITQTGAGNAILVEDSANPDSTPFVVNASGNVGVGTASPLTKLNVEGGELLLRGGQLTIGPTAGGNGAGAIRSTLNGVLGSLIFQTEDSNAALVDRMTLDSSGNLGLGVTPSANAGINTLSVAGQGGGFAALTMGGNATQSGYVGYNMGTTSTSDTWKYITADTGSVIFFKGNEVQFRQFGSGSAGATTNGTQAMTLDASGNLLVGRTTSDGYRLALLGATQKTTGLQLTYQGVQAASISVTSTSALAFGVDGADGSTERARITSGGIFQVSSGGSVQVGGTAARATTAGTNRLDIFDGTAPVGTLTNGISIYSSSGEAYVMDAAGNATLFSPHDAETNEWIFKSKHTPTGKVLKIDVERLLKFVNDHFGLDAVHEFVEE